MPGRMDYRPGISAPLPAGVAAPRRGRVPQPAAPMRDYQPACPPLEQPPHPPAIRHAASPSQDRPRPGLLSTGRRGCARDTGGRYSEREFDRL